MCLKMFLEEQAKERHVCLKNVTFEYQFIEFNIFHRVPCKVHVSILVRLMIAEH